MLLMDKFYNHRLVYCTNPNLQPDYEVAVARDMIDKKYFKMARKKKGEYSDGEMSKFLTFRLTSRETFNTILGIFSVVISAFLLLAAFEAAGRVGSVSYELLSTLFGIGYYLMPGVSLLLGISLLHEREREFAIPQIFGSSLLFLSALGLVDLVSTKGGVVGELISNPLVGLFDIYVTALFLVALMIIGVLVIFDIPLRLNLIGWFKQLFSKEADFEEQSALEVAAIEKAIEEVERVEPRDKTTEALAYKSKKSESEGFVPMITRKSGKVWAPPPLALLERDSGKPGVGDIKANANIIKRTLLNFGIMVEMDEISIGPSVTRYALKPAEGVKLSKILGLQNNLELALAAHPVRIEAPIPGKSLVGIEIPNTAKSTIGLGSLISESEYTKSDKPLLIALGKDITGHSIFDNISKMPHLLIAGATGSGKSVTIHAIINSLLYRNPPENLKFIMIDPKRVELTLYNGIPHLLTPVITDPKKAIMSLKWLAKEMERRYDILEKASVRDVSSYHKNVFSPTLDKKKEGEELPDAMPYILVVIDELADLMQSYPRELESAIVRLAQMSRAVGIHLILSTQRPSVNVITGLIKANIPSRVALQVVSQIDSRTILDSPGAEKLLGAGDMLFQSGEMSKPIRIQSAFIREAEVKAVVKHLKDSYADELRDEINFTANNTSNAIFSTSLENDEFDGDDDDLYEEARETIVHAGKASTSYLQRKLRIGYARAARLMDMLEERGVISAGDGAKPREVIGVEVRSTEYEVGGDNAEKESL
ncbi:MAG: DNA translocase FtsK [Candidatus Zambryskibacteria bacterium]|nr:DNA translocase FtsK [Candidatus Zambryskibacteria bacterium]